MKQISKKTGRDKAMYWKLFFNRRGVCLLIGLNIGYSGFCFYNGIYDSALQAGLNAIWLWMVNSLSALKDIYCIKNRELVVSLFAIKIYLFEEIKKASPKEAKNYATIISYINKEIEKNGRD